MITWWFRTAGWFFHSRSWIWDSCLPRPKLSLFDLWLTSRLHKTRFEYIQGTKLSTTVSFQWERLGTSELRSFSESLLPQHCPVTTLVPSGCWLSFSQTSEEGFVALLLGNTWKGLARVLGYLCPGRDFPGHLSEDKTLGLEWTRPWRAPPFTSNKCILGKMEV